MKGYRPKRVSAEFSYSTGKGGMIIVFIIVPPIKVGLPRLSCAADSWGSIRPQCSRIRRWSQMGWLLSDGHPHQQSRLRPGGWT